MSPIQRIDAHRHYLRQRYREEAVACGHEHPDGIGRLPDWNTESAVEVMGGADIETAMLSVSSPGVHSGDDAHAADLARHVNEEGARVVSDPGCRTR